MTSRITLTVILLFLVLGALSQSRKPGQISGRVMDARTQQPVEYANLIVLDSVTGKMVSGIVSDSMGRFRIGDLPPGIFFLEYSFIGYEKKRTPALIIQRKQTSLDLGTLSLNPSAIDMEEVTVTGEKTMMINKIDRKVFNVEKDLRAQTGTVTDLLQTIPSVSVDIDGNISLRGSGNVMILINGRPSLMANSANLEQMPASMIERIEVITNPSARFKPDGTAGIINIILKKERKAGFNTILGLNGGNNSRFNSNLQGNYNAGPVNVFGSYGYRQDYRSRTGEVASETIDTAAGRSSWFEQISDGYGWSRSHLGQLGFDWTPDKKNTTGLSGTWHQRSNRRTNTDRNAYFDSLHTVYQQYTRTLSGRESEESFGVTGFYEHAFNRKEEHVFRLDAEYQQESERENDRWVNDFHVPAPTREQERTEGRSTNRNIDLSVNYSRQIGETFSLETGYQQTIDLSDRRQDVFRLGSETGLWVQDTASGNRFRANQTVYALYGTLSAGFGIFSVMAGLRAEEATIDLEFLSLDASARNDYFALYPTLHLLLASGKNEWQLNYSKRVNRPNTEEMNPVPEYRDPRNYYVGNPNLKPEDIHSVELGYLWRQGGVNITPSLFYRYKVNGFTRVTESVNDTILRSTIENLARDQSAGIDISGTANLWKALSLNFSASGFYSRIDASNIGYGSDRETFSWSAKLNATVNITRTTMVQVNGQYRSEMLTPQGYRRPSGVVNLGFRQDLWKKRVSLIATVSDLFNSQRMKNSIDTPVLIQESVRRRDARVIFAGLVFNFGTTGKKQKETRFEYDNGMDRN